MALLQNGSGEIDGSQQGGKPQTGGQCHRRGRPGGSHASQQTNDCHQQQDRETDMQAHAQHAEDCGGASGRLHASQRIPGVVQTAPDSTLQGGNQPFG
ncbi:hypothetical protein D3C73_987640 [compost metagenome]